MRWVNHPALASPRSALNSSGHQRCAPDRCSSGQPKRQLRRPDDVPPKRGTVRVPRLGDMTIQRMDNPRRLAVTTLGHKNVEDLAVLIYRPVEVVPATGNLHIRLVHEPSVARGRGVRPTTRSGLTRSESPMTHIWFNHVAHR